MEFLWYVLVFYLGATFGFLLRWWLHSRASYNGAILVNKEEGKTVYSLILDDYPEKIEFRKEVILKVIAPEQSLNRE